MRNHLIALTLLASLLVTGCGFGSAKQQTGPATTPAIPVAQPEVVKPAEPKVTAPSLPGDQTGLRLALTEPSSVRYEIVVVEEPVADRTAHLDEILAARQLPEADMLLLVVFAGDNHDIRFAMGSRFFQQQVTVDEMLGLIRGLYFPQKNSGDPAAGLTELIRAVNQRMGR